jgi:Galactoside-binding lectin
VIGGTAAVGCESFKIILGNGEDDMYIQANLKQKLITINAYEERHWSESVIVPSSLLEDGKSFKFYVYASDLAFKISLNGIHMANFACQPMLNKITRIWIIGDLEKISQVDHRRTFPIPWPPVQDDKNFAFSCDVPMRFSPGSAIIINMRVGGSPKGSFYFRFNEYASQRMLFLFNACFVKKVVLSNCMDYTLQ